MPFIETPDHRPAARELDDPRLRARFIPPPKQLELFSGSVTSPTDTTVETPPPAPNGPPLLEF
jgi:hypothetical protein